MEQISPRLLDFDQNRTPIPPRDAASVVVLRDGPGGLEVLTVVRHARSVFMGGALVFPGGKVDPSDGAGVWAKHVTTPHPRVSVFADDFSDIGAPGRDKRPDPRAIAVAACRETLEEASILPVDGPLPDAAVVELAAELRAATAGNEPALATALERRGLRLALGTLVPWARWVTPEAESRRYDARFFLLALPPGQIGRHDNHETTMSFWATPTDVLERAARGEVMLAPPTSRTLELLAGAPRLEAALQLAADQSLLPVCPRFVPGEGGGPPFLALPGDPAHEIAERRVGGPTRYVLRDGRFVSEEPPCASPSTTDDVMTRPETPGEA